MEAKQEEEKGEALRPFAYLPHDAIGGKTGITCCRLRILMAALWKSSFDRAAL